MRTKLLVLSILSIVFLVSSWSLLRPEFFRTHDYVHGARIAEMSRALQDGHFPPRWSAHFGYGYGMPLFEFYAPLPFFVGALFFLAGLPIVLASKLLFLIPNLVTAVVGYKVAKSLFGRTGGLISAAALTLAPYRAVNLYVRGAVSEAWGMMAMLVSLYGLVLVFSKRPYGWVALFAGIVTLSLSHNLSLLMFSMFAPLFVLALLVRAHVQAQRGLQPSAFLRTLQEHAVRLSVSLGAAILGVGASLFYLLPALLEKDYTHVSEAVTGGFFVYSLHFLYLRQLLEPNWGYGGSIWGPDDDISFFLGYGHLALGLAVAASAGLLFLKRLPIIQLKQVRVPKVAVVTASMLLAVAGIAVLLTTFKAQFVWDAVPAFEYIQFPWRFLGVVVLALGTAVGAVGLLLPKRWRVLAGTALAASFALLNATFFQPEAYLPDASSFYYTDAARIQSEMSGVLYDYIPKGVPLITTPPEEQVLCPDAPDECSLTLIQQATQFHRYHSELNSEQRVVFSVAYFPGWEVLVGPDRVQTEQYDGLVSAVIPSGTQEVLVRFGSTPVRQTADTVTLFFWALSALIVVLQVFLSSKRGTT